MVYYLLFILNLILSYVDNKYVDIIMCMHGAEADRTCIVYLTFDSSSLKTTLFLKIAAFRQEKSAEESEASKLTTIFLSINQRKFANITFLRSTCVN